MKNIKFYKIGYDIYIDLITGACGPLNQHELIRTKNECVNHGIPMYLVDEDGKIIRKVNKIKTEGNI